MPGNLHAHEEEAWSDDMVFKWMQRIQLTEHMANLEVQTNMSTK